MTVVADGAGLLTIDCGNSTLDLLRHDDRARLRLPMASPDLGELASFVRGHVIRLCVAATVVRGGLDAAMRVLAANDIPVRVAGRDLKCPLRLDYETPDTLGVDRWIGAFAAHRLHGRAVVVDCGSATTANLVEADGTFRGGPIGPGLRALAAGMAVVTPALPPAQVDSDPVFPPRSSQAAVDAGVLVGYCGLVERFVSGLLGVARGPAVVVATGGNADLLLRHSRLRAVHVPDLVHTGLGMLAGRLP